LKKDIDATEIYVLCSFEDTCIHAFCFEQRAKSAEVFGQTLAAETDSRLEKGWANPRIQADSVGHFVHIAAKPFAEVREGVGIGNLDGQECVGGLLDEFRASHARQKKFRKFAGRAILNMDGTLKVLLKDRSIELPKSCFRFGVIHSQEYTIRVEETLDGRALAQELGIGRNLEMGLGFRRGYTKQVF
jgi:hypothetical protein